jgi:ATP-dependent helicase HrpB
VNKNIAQVIAGTGLPLVPHLPALCKALAENGAVVLRADPGSGKSTLAPLALLDHCYRDRSGGRIIMLEPRRAAVGGIVSRLAALLGEDIGETAGYAVRLSRRISAKTRIEVVTEGLLTRRMLEQPELFDGAAGGVTLIFDEFHERSIHTDLTFAFALDLRRMGAKLRLLVMSATVDPGRVAAFIDAVEGGTTPVIECPGRAFPVAVRYCPLPQKAPLGGECAAALAAILRDESAGAIADAAPLGDVLVFLPGKREIAGCARALAEQRAIGDVEVLSLHASLSFNEQRRVLAGRNRHCNSLPNTRRIILSTNVAETGLTIPDITLVVDSGFARIQRFHVPTGMNRLALEAISRSSAEQRAGRAGRLGPGKCVRLWPEADARPDAAVPEILRIDLAAAVLDCLLWGVKTSGDLPWLDKPPEAAWNGAVELLQDMGAVDTKGRPTTRGREMSRLGLEPRLARLCLTGRDAGQAALACAAAALLSGRDSSGMDNGDPGFIRRLQALRTARPWTGQTFRIAADLLKRMGCFPPLVWTAGDEAAIGDIIASAFPDRIAKRRVIETEKNSGGKAGPGGQDGIFRFASGREGRIKAPLANAEWLCALEVDAGERMGFIRLALPVSPASALDALQNRIVIEKQVEWKGLVPRLVETKKAGRIVLGEDRRPCRRGEVIPALGPMLQAAGLAALPWEEGRGAPRRLLERIRFMAAHTAWPADAWTEEALAAEAADWLGPFLWDGDESAGAVLHAASLRAALEQRLGWDAKCELDRLVPDQFMLPAGGKRPIDYSSGEPVLRIRLQDAFGIPGVCTILSAPVVFHLLSPAGRLIQITRDLGGFWAGSYAEVRKEMRGRYPKHRWPENPGEH